MSRIPVCLAALLIVACDSAGSGSRSDNEDACTGDCSTRYLDQGWTADERDAYYHRSQGTLFVPADWLRALTYGDDEQPAVSKQALALDGLLIEPGDDLPLGFATTVDPTTNTTFAGLTCSNCHTSELYYRGHVIRIDGGGGRTDIFQWVERLVAGLDATITDDAALRAFVTRIAGDEAGADPAVVEQIRAGVVQYLTATRQLADGRGALESPQEGFGRLDPFNSVSFSLFSRLDPGNVTPVDAPVSTPALWNTHRYDYRHYAGFIHQAMARDAVQSITSGSPLVMMPGEAGPEISVPLSDIDGIREIERLVEKLEPPPWPEAVFGAIDPGARDRGEAIYQARCAGCHDVDRGDDQWVLSVMDVGTDANLANDLLDTVVDTGFWGLGEASVPQALQFLSDAILASRRADYTDEEFEELTGGRDNRWREGNGGYKAIPLDGAWATPPYLHNGSVASVYELLLPAAERTARFVVSPVSDFDPVHLGLSDRGAVPEASFTFDATLPGNLNAGHSGPDYGTDLTDPERFDLIEYLKSI